MIVTLAEAKVQLQITTAPGDPGDVYLQQQLTGAEALVLDYVGSTSHWRDIAATWTAETVPAVVKAAILIQCAEAYRFRGDDVEDESPVRVEGIDLSPRVAEYLRRHRDPVVA